MDPRRSRIGITVAVGLFVLIRLPDLIQGTASAVDALAVAVFLALILVPLFGEVTLGGVTLKGEIRRQVKQELDVAEREALRSLASIDLEVLPLWEWERSGVRSDWSLRKIKILTQRITELEEAAAAASESDRVQYHRVLRELYWQWLAVAREVYASSVEFHAIKDRIGRGLGEIAGVPYETEF